MTRSSLKVLVADDASFVHALFRQIAETSPIPFECARADNGRESLELLARGDINLAFIDVNMPEMSGMEAVGAARLTGDKTFMVLMSALTSPRRLQLAHALKVYEYLDKPFGSEEVVAILRTYCRVTDPIKALVVDDSATARRIVRKVLTRGIFNVEVTEAADGQTALACCERGGFDVTFLDCHMPGFDGLQTLERLMDRNPTAKVIMMTADHSEGTLHWALDRGATAFLYKPFSTADIDRELHALFGLKLPELSTQDTGDLHAAADAAAWS